MKWLLILAAVGLLVIPKLLGANNYMRSGGSAMAGGSNSENAFARLQQGLLDLQDEQNAAFERKQSLNNFSTRPLVANPLARCLAMDENVKQFMWGDNLISSFVWTLPRVLFPWKVRFSAMEGLLFRYFPDQTFLQDTADSIYLYSYTDFSWFGLLVYPALIALLWVGALFSLSFIKTPLFLWAVFAAWPVTFMMSVGEGVLTGWFIVLRNTVMFTVLIVGIESFRPAKFRRSIAVKTS